MQNWLATFAALAAAVVAVVTLMQSHAVQSSSEALQQATQDAHLEEVMMTLDHHFSSHPELRPFFYASWNGSTAPRPPVKLRAQALATAEMIIDYADDIAAYLQRSKMDNKSATHWVKLIRSYFDESPTLRLAWRHFHASYGAATACVLGGPTVFVWTHRVDGQKTTTKWSWRTGRPTHRVKASRCQGLAIYG